MKITFPALITQDVTREIDEEDLAVLNDLLVDSFLTTVQYATFSNVYPSPFERKVIAICEKYGVNPAYPEYRLSFFRAVLGKK